MRGLTKLASRLLLLAAFVAVFVIAITDHSDDYGRITVAQASGTVTLPKGTVKIFFDEGAEAGGGTNRRLHAPLGVKVVPAAGGPALALLRTTPGAEGAVTERSSELGATGSLAELEVPIAGDYLVAVSGSPATGGAITFGADRFTAIGRSWKLWCGLLAGGLLLAIVPVPRRRRPSLSEPSPA